MEGMMRRFQFELESDRAKELDDLKAKLRVGTMKDLINNALALLEWAVEEQEAGRGIASIDKQNDRYYELLMPVLRNIRATARAEARVATPAKVVG